MEEIKKFMAMQEKELQSEIDIMHKLMMMQATNRPQELDSSSSDEFLT